MTAIKAIYDGTGFQPLQPIPVKERCEVIITFMPSIEEVQTDTVTIAEPADVERVAARILKKHIKAFEELAK